MAGRPRASFALGLAIFVVGGATAAFFALRDSGSEEATESTTRVLVSRAAIASGTSGPNAVAQDLVESRELATSALPDGALTDVSQLASRISVVPIEAGQILTQAQFPPGQTRIGTLRIPEGTTALAVQLENVPGVAGFAGAGDRVDIYGVVGADRDVPGGVRLVMPAIEVLNVNGTVLAPAQGQPGGTGLVFLLAVTPAQAERLVYLASFQRLYFTLVPEGREGPPETPGIGPADVLQVG